MFLFLFLLIGTIISIIFTVWNNGYCKLKKPTDKSNKLYKILYKIFQWAWDDYGILTTGVCVIFCSCCLIASVGLAVISYKYPQDLARKEAEYEAIVFQLKANMYENNSDSAGITIATDEQGKITTQTVVSGYGQYQLMQDVKNYNMWYSGYRSMENSWFVGCYYPKMSDKLEYINLSDYYTVVPDIP